MRIYELNPILDGDILGSQVLALDDSTQTRKISLDQIRVFLGVGENSTLIPSGTNIYDYFLTAKSGSYYGEGLVNTAQGGAWAAFDWTTHDQGRGTLTETNNVNELAVHSLAAGMWTKKKIISESGGEVSTLTITHQTAPILYMYEQDTQQRYAIVVDARGFRINENDAGGPNVISWTPADETVRTSGLFEPEHYTNFDARYVRQIQLGAEVTIPAGGHDVKSSLPAGHCQTAVYTVNPGTGATLVNIYGKPIQQDLGGAWITIPG